jgi:hypothetical protein
LRAAISTESFSARAFGHVASFGLERPAKLLRRARDETLVRVRRAPAQLMVEMSDDQLPAMQPGGLREQMQ